MRKAIGTSIRSATSTLRRLERYQQHLVPLQNQGNLDLDDRDEEMYDANGTDTVLDGTDDIGADKDDEDEGDESENEDDEDVNEGDEGEDGHDNQDGDEEMECSAMDEELDDDE